MFRFPLQLFCLLFPWRIKRRLLHWFFGYQLHPKAYIGLAWVYPDQLIMEEGSRIGHFTVAIHLDEVRMQAKATIGRNNWITGFSSKLASKHFQHQPNRISALYMGEGAAITKHHHIDCTSPIHIGKFTTIAGYYSQLLTHSIDIYESRQDSHPISIGDYCFVGTNVVILGGARLPDYSVLGAKSLLNKSYEQPYMLYGGNPAKPIQAIDASAKYFHRQQPFVF